MRLEALLQRLNQFAWSKYVENRRSRTIRRARLTGTFLFATPLLLITLAVFASQLGAQNTSTSAAAARSHRKVVVSRDPEYPAIMKNGHFEGQVRVEATVLANGNVSKVEIKGGNPILAQCAVEAVMKWKYAPGPAQTVEEVTFNFNADVR